MIEDGIERRDGPLPVCIAADRAAAEEALAAEIADLAGADPTVLGLASGRTMRGVYAALVRLFRERDLDPGRLATFNLDEYADLAPDHPHSLRSQMREVLFEPLGLEPRQVAFPEAAGKDSATATLCEAYERAIRDAGGIDLQLLGIGRNGHVAFNEPGSTRDSRTRAIALDEHTRRDAAETFGGLANVPLRAVTMGIATILEARRLRLLAFGASKASIVARLLSEPTGPDLPATLLRGHPDVELWLDPEAAAELG